MKAHIQVIKLQKKRLKKLTPKKKKKKHLRIFFFIAQKILINQLITTMFKNKIEFVSNTWTFGQYHQEISTSQKTKKKSQYRLSTYIIR